MYACSFIYRTSQQPDALICIRNLILKTLCKQLPANPQSQNCWNSSDKLWEPLGRYWNLDGPAIRHANRADSPESIRRNTSIFIAFKRPKTRFPWRFQFGSPERFAGIGPSRFWKNCPLEVPTSVPLIAITGVLCKLWVRKPRLNLILQW